MAAVVLDVNFKLQLTVFFCRSSDVLKVTWTATLFNTNWFQLATLKKMHYLMKLKFFENNIIAIAHRRIH